MSYYTTRGIRGRWTEQQLLQKCETCTDCNGE